MSSSTTAAAFVKTPLDVVKDCFLPPAATTTSSSSTSPHARVADAYRTFLQAHPEALASIPLLQPTTWSHDSAPGGRLHNHCLVRFRGMVTDMLDPQFFIGAHKDPRTGKVLCTMYRDALTAEEEEAMPVGGEWQPHQTMERRPLILGPIPGEAAWVTRTTSSSSSSSSNKRPLSEGEDAMITTTMNEVEGEAAAGEGRTKMARTEERANNDNEGMMAVDDAATNNSAASSSSMPPPPPRAKKAADASPSPPFRCLTYFYDNEEDGSHPPKLNEALDVLAVLSYTTAAEKEKMMMEGGEGGEGGAEGGSVGMDEDDPDAAMDRLMLSLEPRLHVLLWERASLLLPPTPTTSDTTAAAAAASDMSSSTSAAPFAGAASPSPRPLPLLLPANHTITQARTELLTHFTHALAGDALAAEYILLALLSRVRLRTTAAAASSGATAGGEVVVGPLPLNLSRVSIPGFAQGLQALLGSVVARVATVEVSLPSLGDATKWIPRKDYESNMLLSSTPLQATPGTVFILDETDLETGRLDGVGVTNVRCVKKLIEEQKTMCGFGFYELEFEADCPILVVSKSRSIFSGGALCEVPLLPSSTAASASTEAASEAAAAEAVAAAAVVAVPPGSLEGVVGPEVLPSLRRYLAALSGFPVEIDKALASQAEEEYVSLRGGGTEEGKQLTPEDLGRWLEMTRLLCASEGGGKVCGVRHWGRMKELEGERRRRVKAAQGGNVAQ